MLQSMNRAFGGLTPGLPRALWLLQAGVLVDFFGNGLVAPFLVIYLHFGRGIPIALAGPAVALGGITAVASGLVAGAAADRLGPRNTLVAGMLCNAAAYFAYTQVAQPWEAFAVGLLVGVGTGSYGPSSQSLIASIVPAGMRQMAYAQNRVTSVVGLGLGAMLGGVIAARGLPGYLLLLKLDVITFVAFAVVSLLLPAGKVEARAAVQAGYRAVARDAAFMRLLATNIALVTFGIAPMLVLLPAYAKVQAGVGELAIGGIYAANTLTIVTLQLRLARMTRGHSRMRVLRLGALIWVVSWLVSLAAGAWLTGAAAALVLVAAAIAYGVGECLYSAIVLPTAAAMAPEHLRGRYLGGVGLAWQTGFLLGPSLGAAMLSAFPLGLPMMCAAGCLLAAGATSTVERNPAPELRLIPLPAGAS